MAIVNLTPYLSLLLFSNLLVIPPPFILFSGYLFLCMYKTFCILKKICTLHYSVPLDTANVTGTEPCKEVWISEWMYCNCMDACYVNKIPTKKKTPPLYVQRRTHHWRSSTRRRSWSGRVSLPVTLMWSRGLSPRNTDPSSEIRWVTQGRNTGRST